jgi:hypothetical protein
MYDIRFGLMVPFMFGVSFYVTGWKWILSGRKDLSLEHQPYVKPEYRVMRRVERQGPEAADSLVKSSPLWLDEEDMTANTSGRKKVEVRQTKLPSAMEDSFLIRTPRLGNQGAAE